MSFFNIASRRNELLIGFIHTCSSRFNFLIRIHIYIRIYVASHLLHLLSFIVIGVWKSNVTAIVRRVVVLKEMAKMAVRYVKRITLTFSFSFLSSHPSYTLFARIVSSNVDEILLMSRVH